MKRLGKGGGDWRGGRVKGWTKQAVGVNGGDGKLKGTGWWMGRVCLVEGERMYKRGGGGGGGGEGEWGDGDGR